MMNQNTTETVREFALAFRTQYPNLIRETTIDLQEGENLSYGEAPVLDDGNIGEYRHIGSGGRMKATTGNILVYNRGSYYDYSVILPNMACDNTFTDDERLIGEMWALMGPEQ